MQSSFLEAIVLGVITILLGLLFSIIFSFLNPDLPVQCKDWDKNYVMEAILFAIGFSLYYILNNNTIKNYLNNLMY